LTRSKFKTFCATFLLATSVGSVSALADTVTLKNGDKLTGKVTDITGGTMTFNSALAGSVKIEMENVESFQTDAPLPTQLTTGEAGQPVTGGSATTVTTAAGASVPLTQVRSVNPAGEKWTGAIIANFSLARGNTNTLDAGLQADATLRRDDVTNDDRFNLGARYNYSKNGRGDSATTSADNWLASAQYDRFWTEKLYGYANIKYEHDRIAELNYRLAPGVGLGYQWIETPKMNFSTEAGLTYVFEDYENGGQEDSISVRLAYHYDNKLSDTVSMFHNLEYIPAIEDPGDYILTTDIGVRANLTKAMFTQAKFEWKRDSQPADDSLRNDVKFILGVGWQF